MSKYFYVLLAALLLAVLLVLAGAAGAAVDDSYTKSLLHFNGPNGGTTFTDESGKTWTIQGGMLYSQTKTDHYKFGGASGYFQGYIETANSPDFEPGAEPFTIDFWIYPLDAGNDTYLAGKSIPDAGQGYDIRLDHQTIRVSGVNGWGFNITSDASGTANAWHHVAVSSTTATVYLFIDGVLKGSCPRSAITPQNRPFRIGYNTDFTGGGFWGYIDEFRFSKGVARWTADFTPPRQPYGANGTVNLAFLHGVASASSAQVEPSKAIDGSWQLGWEANGTIIPSWLQVDLRKGYKLDHIVLVGKTASPGYITNGYNLYTSLDGSNWKFIHSGIISSSTDPTVYAQTISLDPIRVGRYVKYEVTGGILPYLMEMEIWGNPKPIIPLGPQNSLLLDED